MKKIKVLHIITRLIIGGAQENTVYTVNGLKKLGYDVTLYTGPPLGPEGSLLNKAEDLGVSPSIIYSLRRNLNPFFDYASFITLYSLIKNNKYNIVHTHSSKAGIIGRWASYFNNVPVIIHTIHGLPFFPYQPPFLNFLYVNSERFTSKITDKIITVCDAMKIKALKAGVGKESQYVTIYSGMELGKFLNSRSSNELKKKLGIKENEIVIGKIARLFPLKGHKFVIDIAKDVIKKFPMVKFLFVGDGILKDELIKKCKKLGIDKNFVFAGLIPPSEIPSYLSIMDIVIHTSLREGLARVIPQAFACGKPVITWEIDGSGEVIKNGKTGILVPPEDKEKLKKALISLINNSKLREDIGKEAKKIVDPIFRTEEMVKRIHEVYQETLKKKGIK